MTEHHGDDTPSRENSRVRWPIGFMLLIGALGIYLGWRLIQGIEAVLRWLTG